MSKVKLTAMAMKRYDYRNCQSLFGYALRVHQRDGWRCQLCEPSGMPLTFDLWRQLSIEHLIGESQGGYLNQIRKIIADQFPTIAPDVREQLAQRLHDANTVTACRFCNSTTSRDRNQKTMAELLSDAANASRSADETIEQVIAELQKILDRKRTDVQWKLESVREAFNTHIMPAPDNGGVA